MAKPLIDRIDCKGLGEACDAAAEIVSLTVNEALTAHQRCHVSLTGGTTPRPLYERMAANTGSPWARAHWYWSDERCVPPDHAESNYRMTAESFLRPARIAAGQVHRMEGERDQVEAAANYDRLVREVANNDGFDLVVLGMGADGHVASLFPGHAALEERDRHVIAIEGASSLPTPNRLTWTLPAINSARLLLLLIVGDAKRKVADEILANRDALTDQYPAARVSARDRVVWIIG